MKNDIEVSIAVGSSRRETKWRNCEMLWSEFVSKVKETHRTHETQAQYLNLPKSRQDEIKDVGGFVGGTLTGGRRKQDNVLNRCLITLDADFAKNDIWDAFTMLYGKAGLIYSTHKHTSQNPRLRLVIPLSQPITRDKYEPIGRKIAFDLGINNFDDTTYQPHRLMFWPSTSSDGEYYFKYLDGEFLDPEQVLAGYDDWRDCSNWPVSDRTNEVIQKNIKKQGDPLEKGGVIGGFCRTYSISDVIEKFLADEYEACGNDRYTYRAGSTAAGLIVYDDKYAYSHHGTDPVGGRLCNAFDLVRIHRYGLLDEDVKEGTAHNRLPSYLAMTEFAINDTGTKKTMVSERLNQAFSDFENVDTTDSNDTQWQEKLEVDSKGRIISSIANVVLILKNDRHLSGKLALNEFEHREVLTGDLPWREYSPSNNYLTNSDDSNIRLYLEKHYGISGQPKITDALTVVLSENTFHPVKEYLDSCQWDGVERLDTLFIDYLGAQDNQVTRLMTRKTFVAAVARIYEPGCKFDYVLTLIGAQGIGKSSLLKKMGNSWFSDSLDTVIGKDAYELLQGVWLVEFGELAGLRKAEVDQIKHFISKQEDRYRVAYGKRVENFPRQCIFFGTTNNRSFLKDATGNRRFWPIDCSDCKPTKSVFQDLTAEQVSLIWAEAIHHYKQGERLYLDRNMEEEAMSRQEAHTEESGKAGLIEEYLNTRIPSNWAQMDILARRSFLNRDKESMDFEEDDVLILRDKICIAEIWCECFDGNRKDINTGSTKELHNIMKKMEGWEEYRGNERGHLRFPIYGRQKAYVRSVNKEEDS